MLGLGLLMERLLLTLLLVLNMHLLRLLLVQPYVFAEHHYELVAHTDLVYFFSFNLQYLRRQLSDFVVAVT